MLPQGVLVSWYNEAKTLPNWLVFFQAAEQHDEAFTSSGDYEASLQQKQQPKKDRGGQDTFVLSEVESHNM